ncbi:MAG: carbon-nitrogen hydrolase family protein [Armatimonadetes bacterium]|nr:carbon-nitrogen hydrolase family protein [Armatimonadota bacterium]
MREIRVASIQPVRQPHLDPFGGERDRAMGRAKIEENLEMACRLLDRAGREGCDIACYPEDIQGIAHYSYYQDDPGLFAGFVEEIPGLTAALIAGAAREHRMNIVFGLFEREGERIYNTAVLMGRDGSILGKYRKVHLPFSETWAETSGDSFPVFRTDFGTVGIMICYDINFPESARCLALHGAEILFHPTMGYSVAGMCEGNGLMRVRMRAMDNLVPVVVATCGQDSVIAGSDGSVLAMARPEQEDIVYATIDLDAAPEDHSQWEIITGTADMKARLFQERKPGAYAAITDPNPPLLERYRHPGKRLRSSPEEIRASYEEIRKWWSH